MQVTCSWNRVPIELLWTSLYKSRNHEQIQAPKAQSPSPATASNSGWSRRRALSFSPLACSKAIKASSMVAGTEKPDQCSFFDVKCTMVDSRRSLFNNSPHAIDYHGQNRNGDEWNTMCFLRAEYIIGEVHRNNSVMKKMKKNEKNWIGSKIDGFWGGSGTTVKYSFSTLKYIFSTLKYIFSTILPRSDHGTITAPVSTNSFFSQLNMCLCSHAVAK